MDFTGLSDRTTHKILSVTKTTRDILGGLTSPLTITYFGPFSRSDLSGAMQYHSRRVLALLHHLSDQGPLVKISIRDTHRNLDAFEMAKRKGLRLVQVGSQKFVWGIAFEYKEEDRAIPSLDVNRPEQLEPMIAKVVQDLTVKKKPVLGVISELPLLGEHVDPRFHEGREWFVIRTLKRSFDIRLLDPSSPDLSQDIDLILVVGGYGLNKIIWRRILDFMQTGKGAIIGLDSFCRVCEKVDPRSSGFQSFNDVIGDEFGIYFHGDKIVGDSSLATPIQMVGGDFLYPFFLDLKQIHIAQVPGLTEHFKSISYIEGGYFKIKDSRDTKRDSLLTLANSAGTVASEAVHIQSSRQMAKSLEPAGHAFELAFLFDSRGQPFHSAKKSVGPLFVFGDIDMLHDRYATERQRIDDWYFLKPKNDNIALIENIAESFSGHEKVQLPKGYSDSFTSFESFGRTQLSDDSEFPKKIRQLQSDLLRAKEKLVSFSDVSHDSLHRARESLASLREEEILLSRKLAAFEEKLIGPKERLIFWHRLVFLFFVPGLIIACSWWLSLWRTRRLRRLIL